MKTEHELKVTPYINADHKPEGHYFFAEDALAVLLANDIVFLNAYWWEDSWPEECRRLTALLVNCNDLFAWGTADAEPLEYGEIENLYQHWLKDPRYGTDVWCIKKRNWMPQKPVYDRIMEAGIWDLDSMGLDPNE